MAWATLIMIGALLAQFVRGMAANLICNHPAHHSGARPGTKRLPELADLCMAAGAVGPAIKRAESAF